ncbi:Putative alpha beta hydrolase fold family protein [Tolypocladium paradoxum]|uniref:Alpha beta hydrolase fold family protein n=1 Tax=Tolypocladium paradoxum TaxID=94208 RepID=A0A2S4KW19_9HYPO|nr:Putative alpha beta hydrolase fold family protein [Tolypocladium paradoxum]
MPSVELNGVSLYYTWKSASQVGPLPVANPTLVFVHGLGSSSSFYASVVPGLVEAGFSCLALDTYEMLDIDGKCCNSGSCQSKSGGEVRPIKRLAEDVAALMGKLKIAAEHTVLVGHSMGCLIVSELASSRRVAGTVLLGPIRPSSALANVFQERIKTVSLCPFQENAAAVVVVNLKTIDVCSDGMEAMADVIPSAATGSKCSLTQQAFVRALLMSQTVEGYSASCKAIAEATTPDYGGIKCPLMVIAGADDKTAPVEIAQDVLNSHLSSWGTRMEDKHIEVLEGVGHWHCVEAAGQITEIVRTFLGGLSS